MPSYFYDGTVATCKRFILYFMVVGGYF